MTIEKILRQVTESESFRWIVERRHLEQAADEIERLRDVETQLLGEIAYLKAEIDRHDDMACRAVEEAKHDAYAEAEREMRREFRERGEW